VGLRLVNPPSCPGLVVRYGAGCPGSGGFTPAFAVDGCPTAGGTITFDLREALGGSGAAMVVGTDRAALTLPGGCQLLVNPIALTLSTLILSPGRAGGGAVVLPLRVPADLVGARLTAQMFVFDPGVPHGYTATNGIELTVR
jgi:hypothetical protein